MTDKTEPLPRHPFYKKAWAHLKKFRESYLFPAVGVVVLILGIYLYRWLTGRAPTEDPSSIILGIYNAILVIVALSIVGGLQGHQIPDVDEEKPGQNWQTHFINCLCFLGTFYLVLRFIFWSAGQ